MFDCQRSMAIELNVGWLKEQKNSNCSQTSSDLSKCRKYFYFDIQQGRLNFTCACPDSSFTFVFGGEKDGVRVLNLLDTAAGMSI